MVDNSSRQGGFVRQELSYTSFVIGFRYQLQYKYCDESHISEEFFSEHLQNIGVLVFIMHKFAFTLVLPRTLKMRRDGS